MKKLLPFFGVLGAFFILAISMVRYSRENISQTTYGSENMSSSSAQIKSYYLPYPGMLPDHPLYMLKMIRDRGQLIFTNDLRKKAKLYIYYGDKRIGAAKVLLEGRRVSLAEDTGKKAEQYLGNAFDQILSLDESGEMVDDLWEIFYDSSSSHHRLLIEMVAMVEGDARVSFEKILESCTRYKNEASGRLGLDGLGEENEMMDDESLDPGKGYL